MKKRHKVMMAGLLLISLILMAGCNSTIAGNSGSPVVSRATARTGTLTNGAVSSGKLEALNAANIVPKTSGKAASILVDVGSEVKEGDLLLTLDAADLVALVDLSAAQLDKVRNSDLPSQENQAQLNLANTGASYKKAEADYQRNKQLADAAAISKQQLEQSEKDYLQAKAAYEAAQNSLSILENATIPETIRQCEAQLSKARADYENTVIKAPFSGIVTARNINPGEMASPSTPVISLVNLDTVLVQANVSEDQINKIKVGQELQVKIGSVQQEPFKGTVTNIALAANSSTKAYPVKVQIQNPGHILKPGMFTEVYLAAGESGIIVPREAVIVNGDKSMVWIIENGSVKSREVVTGLSDGKDILVTSGLKDGEEVALGGSNSLQDGMKVTVQ